MTALAVAAAVVLAACGGEGALPTVDAAPARPQPEPTTTTSPATTTSTTVPVASTTAPPPPTTAAPTTSTTAPPTTTTTTTTAPPPPTTAAAPPAPWRAGPGGLAALAPGEAVAPFEGFGVWLDVLDWSPTYTGGRQGFSLAGVDRLADLGVQTIYIQTSRFNRSEDVLDEALLRQIIDRAHGRGLHVVAWYLPTFADVERDLRRLVAAATLGVDGVGVDIEDRTTVADHGERTRRLLTLTADLRAWLPTTPLAAVPVPPVATEVINPGFWPGLPWAELAATYDVWMPMAYWTYRTPGSGWRNGERYIGENVRLLRQLTGRPDLPVHPIGGEAATATAAEIDGMIAAVAATGSIGGSLYDHASTPPQRYAQLVALRR